MPLTGTAGTTVQQAALKFSLCRDNRGAAWTTAVTVAAVCDVPSAAGCWLGNRFGALYSNSSGLTQQVYFKWTPNPDDWTINGPITLTGITGRVYGLARNQTGLLCAVIGKYPVTSHDNGLTWTQRAAWTTAEQTCGVTALQHYFVITVPSGKTMTHYVSRDGGETFQ